jgi:cytoskeletal protein RodZ
MSRRSTSIKIATKAAILFGALFLVTVLIAAIPAHQQKAFEVVITPEQPSSQASSAQSQSSPQSADDSSKPGSTSQQSRTARMRSNRNYKTITRPKTISDVTSPQ